MVTLRISREREPSNRLREVREPIEPPVKVETPESILGERLARRLEEQIRRGLNRMECRQLAAVYMGGRG